jgi:hypothetical protein
MAQNKLPTGLIVTTPGPSLRESIQLIFTETAVPYQAPSFRVQPGMVVILTPYTANRLNTDPVSIADRRTLFQTSYAALLAPAADAELVWPCENTANIWAGGTAGDGLLITISKASFG